MTSTRIVCPGRYFATRVARVTPSTICKRPLPSRTTQANGIPCVESPCRANRRASFTGSAPLVPDDGRCNVPGSTSRKRGIGYNSILPKCAPSAVKLRQKPAWIDETLRCCQGAETLTRKIGCHVGIAKPKRLCGIGLGVAEDDQ